MTTYKYVFFVDDPHAPPDADKVAGGSGDMGALSPLDEIIIYGTDSAEVGGLFSGMTREEIHASIKAGMVTLSEAFDDMRDSMLMSVETFEALGMTIIAIGGAGGGGRGPYPFDIRNRQRPARETTFQRMRREDAGKRRRR